MIVEAFKRKRNKLAEKLAAERGCDYPMGYRAMATAILLDEPTIMVRDGVVMFDPISPVNRQ